jgi:molybdopterin adenylyltransferase
LSNAKRTNNFRAGVLTVSDSSASGAREDLSGPALVDGLRGASDPGFVITRTAVVPDSADLISQTLADWCADCDLILTTGGTGLSPRDVTPEATSAVIERPVPGIAEALRSTGYQANPRAILSRGVAGIRGRTLIINLPGSPKAVREGLALLLPLLPHALEILTDSPTDH